MSAQETAEKPTTTRKRPGTKEKAAEQAKQVKDAQNSEDAFKDPSLEEQIEALVPYTGAKIWIIGRGPEEGGEEGKDDGWEKFTQSKLGFIELQQFFALCSRALLKAVKEGGDNAVSEIGGMFGGGGDFRAMSRQLQQQDFNDAQNFMSMAFALISYVPDFLTDCYALWLRVPEAAQWWFKKQVALPYDPDNDQYGLKKEDGKEMIARFLDQNYEEIRDFFVKDVPEMVNRVKELETQRKAKEIERGSDSQRSRSQST